MCLIERFFPKLEQKKALRIIKKNWKIIIFWEKTLFTALYPLPPRTQIIFYRRREEEGRFCKGQILFPQREKNFYRLQVFWLQMGVEYTKQDWATNMIPFFFFVIIYWGFWKVQQWKQLQIWHKWNKKWWLLKKC